ncbi:coiled-coil domain-containing protein 14 isoform X2 [Sardina pilchardus]|uniref:coiled-coil domain-containing protein 14 isoform X2 n=1 Tax=Sardina pilchardus TaxID=27697 RepID=UPI002E112035
MTTRQGLSKHKVISSGRLTSTGRGQPIKKKLPSKPKPTPATGPHYSLYSTDSEDQVTTIHRGLDRCAALLHGILQAEQEEPKPPTAKGAKSDPSKPKLKQCPGRREADKKKPVRKMTSALASALEQKAISTSRSQPALRAQPGYSEEPRPTGDPGGPQMAPPVATAAQWELMQPQVRPLAYPQQQASSVSQHSSGHQGTTMFNCRLATSTPILGPQDATNSQSYASNPMQVHSTPDAQLQQFAQHWVMTTTAPSVPHGVMSTTATPQMTIAQHPTFSSVLTPLHHPTPAAITSMPAPLYNHANLITAPPPQPLLAQHGAFPSGQGVPVHSSPIVSPFPAAMPNQDVPQVLHNVNPVATGTLSTAQMPQPPAQVVGHRGPPQGCPSGESSEYSPTSDEDEADGVDTTPVRDSDSQTGAGTGTGTPAILKVKPLSPEKTAKKVMTVKYLLGELKAMVVNQDSAAVQLINEVENSISLLPAMVGSTNVQAELALALQPLRSENVQLRRRLRILNQQLMERERAEREARPVDCDLEMTSLQSLNLTLQLQLREAHNEMEQIQLENKELRQTVEDKENELQLSRQHSEAEASRIMTDVSGALSEMKSYQSKLESSMMENAALSSSLQQREAEIYRLQEAIRNLQGKITGSSIERLEVMDAPKLNPHLRKHVLEMHQQDQKSSCGSDDISDSVKNYLQSMEEKNLTSSPPRSHLSPQRTPSRSSSQWRGAGLGLPQEQLGSPRLHGVGVLGKGSYSVASDGGFGGGIDFAPLKEAGAALAEPPIRMERSLDGSGALKSLSQIMDRMALTAKGLQCEDGNKPSSANATTSHFKVNPGVLPIPPLTSKRHLDLGETPAAYTGRPSEISLSSTSTFCESQATDWSMNSWSTFNTRDEEVFRTGMAALDASIARLQRTLQVDIRR